MSLRFIKTTAIVFMVLLITSLFLGGIIVRGKHLEQVATVFQKTIPVAEQFVLTYGTMDPGLRRKTSGLIFSTIKSEKSIQAICIMDQNKNILLLWQLNNNLAVENNKVTKIPEAKISSAILETSLPGAAKLLLVATILSDDEISLLFLIGITSLGLFIIFLIFQLLLARPAQNILAESQIITPEEVTAQIPREDYPQPLPKGEKDDLDRENCNQQVTVNQSIDSKFLILDRISGVTQERFLNFRLDKELERSAENAIDMSIALFRFQNLSENDHAGAAQLLLAEFSHEDLIFEYGNDTFCAIMPQHDLDQAIARVDLLIRKSEGRFGRSKKPVLLIAGLSSRNGRLLDSARFIKEAHIALQKANLREGRIVGFRPDPVRFRNFLRHHRV